MNYSDILVVDKKSEIEKAVVEHALYNFGGSYRGYLKIYNKEFDSYEEAEEYLCGLRNDGAVKFKEYDSPKHKNFTMKWMIMVSH